MQLDEIFDTEQDLIWQHQGRFELTTFNIGNVNYTIQIEKKHMAKVPELKGKKTAEVSFFTDASDTKVAHSTTNQMRHVATTVYGVVFNALEKKFQEYDAFYFVARPEHSQNEEQLGKKSDIYLTLANSVATRSNVRVYDQKSNYGNAFLVSKLPVENNADFINEAVEFMKANGLWNSKQNL